MKSKNTKTTLIIFIILFALMTYSYFTYKLGFKHGLEGKSIFKKTEAIDKK